MPPPVLRTARVAILGLTPAESIGADRCTYPLHGVTGRHQVGADVAGAVGALVAARGADRGVRCSAALPVAGWCWSGAPVRLAGATARHSLRRPRCAAPVLSPPASAVPEPSRRSAVSARPGGHLHLLVIEDNETNRLLLEAMLECEVRG